MRYVVIAFFLLIATISRGQILPKGESGKIEYSAVVAVDSSSADVLYSKSKLFVASAFKSARAVTDMQDDVSKTVVAKGWTSVSLGAFIGKSLEMKCWFSMTIQSKEGRYKYLITGFELVYEPGAGAEETIYPLDGNRPGGIPKKQWASIQDQVNEKMTTLIEDLKKAMKESVTSW